MSECKPVPTPVHPKVKFTPEMQANTEKIKAKKKARKKAEGKEANH
jgi:hypothetical protein